MITSEETKCNIAECRSTVVARGYCSGHYKRLLYYGDPLKQVSRQRLEQVSHPRKSWARKKLHYAVQTGKIIKPRVCMGCEKERQLEGHHSDYDWPYAVIWLCKRCHIKWHNRE